MRADPGNLHQLRRRDGSASEKNFDACRDTARLAGTHDFDGDTSIAVEDETCGRSVGEKRQVGTAPNRMQECVRRIPAHAALLVDLEISATEVVATIEILGRRNAD